MNNEVVSLYVEYFVRKAEREVLMAMANSKQNLMDEFIDAIGFPVPFHTAQGFFGQQQLWRAI